MTNKELNEQINKITQKRYLRGNQVTLQAKKRAERYESDEWVTFLQAREISRKIKKGERGVGLVKIVEDEDSRDTYPNYFTVFNIDQTEKHDTETKSD